MYDNKTIDEAMINSFTIVPISLIIVSQIEIYTSKPVTISRICNAP
ncbi:MAG: hypothetical protein K2L56_10225 [Prevotella sp.]|nr:hypothetical protein [Prevotella sp.]